MINRTAASCKNAIPYLLSFCSVSRRSACTSSQEWQSQINIQAALSVQETISHSAVDNTTCVTAGSSCGTVPPTRMEEQAVNDALLRRLREMQSPSSSGSSASLGSSPSTPSIDHPRPHTPSARQRRLDLASIPMLSSRGAYIPPTPVHPQPNTTTASVKSKEQDTEPSKAHTSSESSSSFPSSSDGTSSNGSPARSPLPASPTQPADTGWRQILVQARQQQQQQEQLSHPLPLDSSKEHQRLTDTFGRTHTYLRISLTERCNLRCTYCMPAEGVELTPQGQLLTSSELLHLVSLFAASGVTKVRLTGGEPSLRKDVLELTRGFAALPGIQTVAMTSNGIALGRQLEALKGAGLSAINLSLDTLQPERFLQMSRRDGHSKVMRCIQQAVDAGFDPVKVNAVVMRGVNDDELPAFVEMTRNSPINVRFIEYMPFDGNVWSQKKMVSYQEMLGVVQTAYASEGGLVRERDPSGEVAKNWRVPGFRGTVSFITSMTQHFCGDCNRLRLLADGNLKVCLFGANEVSLRDAMRGGATDEELLLIIRAAVLRKKAAHAGMSVLAATMNRPMITIGG